MPSPTHNDARDLHAFPNPSFSTVEFRVVHNGRLVRVDVPREPISQRFGVLETEHGLLIAYEAHRGRIDAAVRRRAAGGRHRGGSGASVGLVNLAGPPTGIEVFAPRRMNIGGFAEEPTWLPPNTTPCPSPYSIILTAATFRIRFAIALVRPMGVGDPCFASCESRRAMDSP